MDMKPYRRANKLFMQQLRTASGMCRARLYMMQFARDILSLWRYGAPFPTFLKLIVTLLLCVVVIMPLLYPLFILAFTYITYEGLFLSWWHDQPWRFGPLDIFHRVLFLASKTCSPIDKWKVREVLTRGVLLAHSLATSVDYLCVMQGLLDEA